jgi:hypothetical protein
MRYLPAGLFAALSLLLLDPALLWAESTRSISLEASEAGELIKGEKLTLKAEVVFMFDAGSTSYYSLKPEGLRLLTEDPTVDHPPGLTAKVVSLRPSETKITVSQGRTSYTATGYAVSCEVVIGTDGNVTQGDHTVTIGLPGVSKTARIIGASRPTEPPEYHFHVMVWESREAREAAARKRALAWLASAAGGATVAASFVAIVYVRWRVLRRKLAGMSAPISTLEQRGLLATHLVPANWLATFRSSLGKATEALDRVENEAARQAATSLSAIAKAESILASLSLDLACEALEQGTFQSALAKVGEQLVYIVAVPGRHEHSGLFRRYEPLADGWDDHVCRLRKRLDSDSEQAPLLCLLYFLNPQGDGGAFLVAYEGRARRVVPSDLIPVSGGEADTFQLPGNFEFRLA